MHAPILCFKIKVYEYKNKQLQISLSKYLSQKGNYLLEEQEDVETIYVHVHIMNVEPNRLSDQFLCFLSDKSQIIVQRK